MSDDNYLIDPKIKSELEFIGEHFQHVFAENYMRNDPAHDEDHFRNVAQLAHEINIRYELDIDPEAIEIVAWVHDAFAFNRETHHLEAALWVYETKDSVFRAMFPEQRMAIARACAEHRASYKGQYHSPLSELMATADRGFDELIPLVARSLIYTLDQRCELLEMVSDAIENFEKFWFSLQTAVEHVKNKFGASGYQRVTDLYLRCFGEQIERRNKEIDMISALMLKFVTPPAFCTINTGIFLREFRDPTHQYPTGKVPPDLIKFSQDVYAEARALLGPYDQPN